MSVRTQIVVAAVVILALIGLTSMVKKNKIEMKYALIWYLLVAVILVFDLFPNLLGSFAAFMGVDLAVNMLFFLGFCFALVIIFVLTVWVSKLSVKVKRLTQELALLDRKLEETETVRLREGNE